ncbi:O-antigen ligase family protein [Methylomonas sp. SURF-2]|uniref:O-antigen ligase family protein n=1 Tax=Methylomonas subterranea TaxID=2952225 RepID=A0ABT1THP3_9GAMM|nr:O-antigen ligase family protein [Methylomonas sp. SURF-2]MCQ8104977.1 O-antigen ligase family protein [Methylomonas sp. SURF-2]
MSRYSQGGSGRQHHSRIIAWHVLNPIPTNKNMPLFSHPKQLQTQALSIGEKTLPVLIVAIHFSTALTLVVSILIFLLWLTAGCYKNAAAIVKHNQATFFALLLFSALILSASYSSAPFPKALAMISKYRILLLLLILPAFLSTQQRQKLCEKFLLAALISSLAFSLLGYFDLLSPEWVDRFLKSRITHSLFMAFLGFFSMHRLYRNDASRLLWATVLLLVGFDLFVATDGRTGQLTFLLLTALFFLQVFSFRTALLLGMATVALFCVFMFFSPYSARFFEGIEESINFYQRDPSVEHTSMGLRLGFWRDTLTIIGQSPWLGEGAGGIPYKFQQLFPGHPILINPHNEYLLMAAQLGIPGLLLFLAFLAAVLRSTAGLPQAQRWLPQGVWLSLLTSCLFNSSLMDHTEGHWFMFLLALYLTPQSSPQGEAQRISDQTPNARNFATSSPSGETPLRMSPKITSAFVSLMSAHKLP